MLEDVVWASLLLGNIPTSLAVLVLRRTFAANMNTFNELGLREELLKAISEQGYEHPMPVQEQVIPWLVGQDDNHQDLVALAQTGTGKTAAYGLPTLQIVAEQDRGNGLAQALILAPTRELCLQITDDLKGFASHLDEVRIMAVYGGANIEPQIRALRYGTDIIVATPGRLIDLMRRGVADLSQVRVLILDEADEMLSMGFQEELDQILTGVPADHRTLLFSATMSKEIERIAQHYLRDAHQIQVGSRNEGAESVTHIYYQVHAKDKYLALKRVVDFYPRIYAIIFCRTRMETQDVADKLIRDGYNADALHGELSQQQRDLTMQKFRQHRTQLLVATDVAARGLDVDDLSHVINYGMPDDVESYTHRSGRTGRAGKKGTSICIVHVRERGKIRQVEQIIQKQFEQGRLPDPKDICAKQLYHVVDDIERVEVDEEAIAPFMDEVQKRWAWLDKDDIIKRVLSREFGRFLRYYATAPELQEPEQKIDKGEARKGRGKGKAEAGYVRLFVNVGKLDKMYAREIISMINNHVKGEKVEIGRIDLMKTFSFVEVADYDAQRVLKEMKHGVTVKGRSVVVDEADRSEEATKERRERSERKPREAKETREPRTSREPRESRTSRKSSASREASDARGSRTSSDSRKPAKPAKPSKQYTKDDWMQFFTNDGPTKKQKKFQALVGEEPDFSEEGWARRYPKKKK